MTLRSVYSIICFVNKSIFLGLITAVILCGCSLNTQKKYDQLITSSAENVSDVVKSITEFEISNPKHFESKLFLAEYYLSTGDLETGENYLRRAESVKNHAARATKKENLAKLYANLARVKFMQKEYEYVFGYAKEAAKYDVTDEYSMGYLIGHTYVATGNEEEAIKFFDEEYKKAPEKASANDLQAYMYLLNGAERIDECKQIIAEFITKGNWFYGLGTFCSGVFEKAGDIQESLLYAFLDYDYYSSMFQGDDAKFVENIRNVETLLQVNGTYEEAGPVCKLILGLYTDPGSFIGEVKPNFISDYLIIRNKIKTHDVNIVDFNVLLGLEPCLSSFPVYYWSVWECVKQLDEAQLENYIPVLNKVIALSPTSQYSAMAKDEIARIYREGK